MTQATTSNTIEAITNALTFLASLGYTAGGAIVDDLAAARDRLVSLAHGWVPPSREADACLCEDSDDDEKPDLAELGRQVRERKAAHAPVPAAPLYAVVRQMVEDADDTAADPVVAQERMQANLEDAREVLAVARQSKIRGMYDAYDATLTKMYQPVIDALDAEGIEAYVSTGSMGFAGLMLTDERTSRVGCLHGGPSNDQESNNWALCVYPDEDAQGWDASINFHGEMGPPDNDPAELASRVRVCFDNWVEV